MLRGREDPHDRVGKPLGTYSAYLAADTGAMPTITWPRSGGWRCRSPTSCFPDTRRRPDTAEPLPVAGAGKRCSMTGTREMETLVARYRADGPDFLDGVPKALLPDLYYLGDFGGTAVYGFFAASQFFLVDPAGGTGLVDSSRRGSSARPGAGRSHGRSCSRRAERRWGRTQGGGREMPRRNGRPAGRTRIPQGACPTGTVLLPAAELPGRGWFKVTPIPLHRRGFGPMAYLLDWAGKTVLLTGRTPVKVTPRSVAGLAADIGESRTDWQDYQASLANLRASVRTSGCPQLQSMARTPISTATNGNP